MHVLVTTRHMELSPSLKAHAELKANKLVQYFDRIQEIEVVIDHVDGEFGCEVIVNAEHKKEFVAHCKNEDAYTCVNNCIDKIERQVSEHKKSLRNRKHVGEGATIRHA